MTVNINTAEVIDKGMRCLTEHLGVLEAETFISAMLREQSDYTEWHRRFVEATSKEEFKKLVRVADKVSPYRGSPSSII